MVSDKPSWLWPAVEILIDFSIGFVKIGGDKENFAGSGTLVSVGNTKAILTADHVLKTLPKKGLWAWLCLHASVRRCSLRKFKWTSSSERAWVAVRRKPRDRISGY